MPAAADPPTGTLQGSIILIEEYDALAVAIGSALRKFAPRHTLQVAGTLTEAKALAKKAEPALFVIDFDPAFRGLGPFLQKARADYPDARGLVIAGKLPTQIERAARSSGALQFVEKPFDVPDFGAAVQALLGPWIESETATSRGTLQDLTLADLVVAQCAGGRSVALEVTNGNGRTGEIHLRQGAPVHAESGKKSGDDALAEILSWREVEVREREKLGSTRRTIRGDWADALVEAIRRNKSRHPKATQKPQPSKATAKSVKKLVVIDDTDMLLIFVEDVLMTSGETFQITTASDGMSGIKAIERMKPDLVLLDYSLPDINGDEVCRRLLQNDATARIPVLMMSGHVPEMSKAAAILDNVVATIDKPFLSEALISLVQQTLRESRGVRKKTLAARKANGAFAAAATTRVEFPGSPELSAGREAEVAAEPSSAAPPIHKPVEVPSEKIEPTPIEPLTPPVAPKEPKPPIEFPPAPVPAATQPFAPAETPAVPVAPEITPGPGIQALAAAAPAATKQTAPAAGQPPAPVSRPLPVETSASPISTRVVSETPNDVMLSLLLEVVSVQLTPELRMGSIRARPSSGQVTLHIIAPGLRDKLPESGFKLGPVALDGRGRIATVRVTPALLPVKAVPVRNALHIGAVTVVPIDHTSRMQLSAAPDAPMTLQLLAHLELAGVELSPTFQLSQLVLKNRGRPIRVTLNSGTHEENGTACETVAVRLDHTAQIKELLLTPVGHDQVARAV